MNILETFIQLRDDLKSWVTNNLNALNAKIDEKTIPIDSELSSTSTNPVQNKAIKKAIDNIPTFSGDYNDLTNAPDITEDDSGNMVIADESGNIIFKADAEGIHTTAVSLNGEAAASEKYVDEAIANIDIPEVDFSGYATEDYVDGAIAAIPQTDLTGYATETYVNDAIADIPETDLSGYYTKEQTDTAINTAKEELSESIVAESDEWKVVDEAGNIIFSVDATGAHTTALSLNGESVEDIVDERVASLVDSAPDTLNTLNELAAALGDDPNFATTVATEIGKKVDKVNGKGLSTNDFTDAHKNKLDSIDLENITFEESDPTVPAWAKAENKPTYTADEVNALPDTTVLADLSDDADHRTVTDAEKAAWNAKSDFSGDYNDLENAPNITEDESNNLVIADKDGNIIFRSDDGGFETTTLTAQSIILNGMDVEDTINGLDADDFGIYVQAQEPMDAVAGDIWIDTANNPTYIPPTIPEITEADNGKVLMVVNGQLQLVSLNLSIDANGVVSM